MTSLGDMCVNGHLMEGPNAFRNSRGRWGCRVCSRAAVAKYATKKRTERRLRGLPPIEAHHEDRFWEKVIRSGADDCWIWEGPMGSYGYGVFTMEGHRVGAHRFAYEARVAPIRDGLQIDHLCRVRRCVNPAHLETVTPLENWRRGNSFSAVNAAKTHCIYGHEFTAENTIVTKVGKRQCRQCVNESHRRYRRRKSESRNERVGAAA